MRFKLGLCLKLLVGISLVLLSVIFLKQNEVGEFTTQVVDAKNISGFQKQVEVEESFGKSFDSESADHDSLAGNRIDGLPNITSSVRWVKISTAYIIFCYKLQLCNTQLLVLPTSKHRDF